MNDSEQRCKYCDEASRNLKRCAGCKKVSYCSTRCQKDDWTFHIFDCKLGQPISTVYHLARAMYRDVVPVDAQTRIDYGFDKAERMLGGGSGSKLCGLYQGLLKYCEVPVTELRKWQREGRLIEGIKKTYEAIPPDYRGGYYPWFLQHQYILDGTPPDEEVTEENLRNQIDRMFHEGWVYTGGSPHTSSETIRSEIAKFCPKKRQCFNLCSSLLTSSHPNPIEDSWLTFGFVVVSCAGMEQEYSRKYQQLIAGCTFNELYEAYTSSSIPALFERYCGKSPLGNWELFCDVMAGPFGCNKSVWNLKQYIDQLTESGSDNLPSPIRSVSCDYGYMNCRNPSERKLLDDLYKALFDEKRQHTVDPLALHDACIKGELLEFSKKHVKLSPWTAKYTRLLKNPYPLPDLDGLE